ncbi:MAG: anti-sigma factor antagonist [Clostridia bacterium]|nr:anti-sigma factor antagonist [Clostridia bacterium]
MEFDRRRDTVTAYVTGELDQCSAQSIRRELDQLIEDPSVRRLVLDLKNMRFMDSSGIGVILGRYRTLAQRGGTVAVRNMNAHVERIFLLSGMNQIIQII